MSRMTREECLRFLLEKARTAKIGTVRPDGRPHVAPVWFDLDNDVLVFTTWTDTVKARNLRNNPEVSICVDDENPPFAYVQIEGKAEFVDDIDQLLRWATSIGGRYMGQEVAEAFGKRNAVPGELLVRVTPTRIFGEENIAGW
jgi:PPOX class probable F420-dependent enzyme